MPELQKRSKVKEKTSIYSSKIFIAASIMSLIGFVVIVAFITSIFYEGTNSSKRSSSLQSVTQNKLSGDPLITIVATKPQIDDSDPLRGLEGAPVTIVEFGDFECSYCASMKEVLKEVLRTYPQEVNLIWKDFPLTLVHENAYQAAIAARCAQRQEKFWEMHDLLFDNTLFLSRVSYSEYAEALGLDLEEFNRCVNQEETASLVDEGIKQAQDLLIEGTPHFYINEQEISGTATLEDFRKLIEIELEQ